MITLGFRKYISLWDASASDDFTVNEIISYSPGAESSTGVDLLSIEPKQIDVTIDLSAIQAYFESGMQYEISGREYPAILYRYGVRVYNNGALLSAGFIPLDSITINQQQYTFSFTIISTLETYSRIMTDAQFEMDDISFVPPAHPYYPVYIHTLLRAIFTKLNNTLLPGVTSVPSLSLQQTYDDMMIDEIPLTFQGYDGLNCDFQNWSPTNENLHDSDLVYSNYAIGAIQDYQSVSPNKVVAFFFKAWRRYTSDTYVKEMKLVQYTFNLINPLEFDEYINVNYDQISGTAIDPWLQNIFANLTIPTQISFYTGNTQRVWVNDATNPDYTLGDWWEMKLTEFGQILYSGNMQIDWFLPNLRYTGSFSDVIKNLLILSNTAIVHDAAGNMILANKPRLSGTNQTSVDLTDSMLIGSVQTQTPIVIYPDMEGKFDFAINGKQLESVLTEYYRQIAKRYRTKITSALDGINQSLVIGGWVRYIGKQYCITKIQQDHDRNITEFEAYGEV